MTLAFIRPDTHRDG